MTKRIVSSIIAMAVFCGIPAQAEQTPQDMATWLLAKYDLNGDAAITAKEISSKKHKVFLYLDLDQNGAVNIDEYLDGDAKRREAILKARFDKLDLDHNGKVDKEEYSSYLGQFASIDHDGDGNLSQAEVKSTSVAEQPRQVSHCLWVFCIKASQ